MKETQHHIVQGEFATGHSPDVVITTLLGSCVACCLWDPVAQVGGMNHILFAQGTDDSTAHTLSGSHAMETLINALVKLGAERGRFQAKVFGGARMITGLSDIGEQNAGFACRYLRTEGIPIIGHSLGGRHARSVRFWPVQGRVQQRRRSVDLATLDTGRGRGTGNGAELF